MRLISLIILGVVFSVFAASTDSLGTAGIWLRDTLSKLIDPEIIRNAYIGLAPIIGILLTRLIQIGLNSIKTKWYYNDKVGDLTVNFLWKLAAKFFGKSVLYYHMKVKSEKEKALAIAKAKEHLKKHEPLFQIDIEKEVEKNKGTLYDPLK